MLALVAVLVGGATYLFRSDRNDLWRVVHYLCVPDQSLFGRPAPCLHVDPVAGFALAPGFRHADELLLVPTRRITGIEDPALLEPGAANLFARAWDARKLLLDGARPVPDSWVALAVNSVKSRTQDQLHIHIDCVKERVRNALQAAAIGRDWTPVMPLPGRHYQAVFLPGGALDRESPFQLLAMAVGRDPAVMGQQTLALIGAARTPDGQGYYLLRQAFDPATGARGHGEELLDHRCSGLPPDFDAASERREVQETKA